MSSSAHLELVVDAAAVSLPVNQLVLAGWTGRDAAGVEKHLAELEAIGVSRPSRIPCFYPVSAGLLTTADRIQVSGLNTSGEVEFVLFGGPQGLLVGVGSDHTDRKVEEYSVTVSKQMCFKPVAREVWRFVDVSDHWDELVLRSWAIDHGERRLYQAGNVSAIRTPADLVERYLKSAEALPRGTVLFGGTLPVQGGVAAAESFEFELEDPVRNQVLRHHYEVEALPVVS